MECIKPQPGIMDIELYQGGTSHLAGIKDVVKLSSNENPLGPSEKAIEAYSKAAFELNRYPSSDHNSLRAAIGKVYQLDSDRVICGSGSDEIISLLCQAYAGPETEVIHTVHGFSMYRINALIAGAVPVEVVENNRVTDVDAILAAVTERTCLVFFANPNNPTGTMIPTSEVERLINSLPRHTLLVLDGAYAEYVENYDGGASLVEANNNVVMTRTFSKLYGLGGLRVGWGYGPVHVIDTLNRVRGPFNVTQPGLAAAKAAVFDRAYTTHCRVENARCRSWMADKLAEIGVLSDASLANFILARFRDRHEAEACDFYLQSQGIIVRRVSGYNLPAALRITVGDESACRRVVHAIRQLKNGKRV
jgi:histidinol-phosphate aminotransferase